MITIAATLVKEVNKALGEAGRCLGQCCQPADHYTSALDRMIGQAVHSIEVEYGEPEAVGTTFWGRSVEIYLYMDSSLCVYCNDGQGKTHAWTLRRTVDKDAAVNLIRRSAPEQQTLHIVTEDGKNSLCGQDLHQEQLIEMREHLATSPRLFGLARAIRSRKVQGHVQLFSTPADSKDARLCQECSEMDTS